MKVLKDRLRDLSGDIEDELSSSSGNLTYRGTLLHQLLDVAIEQGKLLSAIRLDKVRVVGTPSRHALWFARRRAGKQRKTKVRVPK